MDPSSAWQTFDRSILRYREPALWLDYSRIGLSDSFLEEMAPVVGEALAEMAAIEAGDIVNVDERRMVGHYWLRTPDRAPQGIGTEIQRQVAGAKAFANGIHNGEIPAPGGARFTDLLLIGIGGSALGPQLAADALGGPGQALAVTFLDNTDPDGIARALDLLSGRLATTLVLIISKSGGTPETRNGMLEAKAAFEAAGLDFPAHAVAITGPGSKLDQLADDEGWLGRFPMEDWVGGRTSVTSVVGLVPMALLGFDIDAFLAGAAATDALTRSSGTRSNASLLLALAWHRATLGRGAEDMVVLPYSDRLGLFSKYLQQLVMESLGKRLNRSGRPVYQGIAVYGNKGSTDQHAYVQQLRDGLDNFFATFIEVRENTPPGPAVEVAPGVTSGDYLQGFLRGTRDALHERGRGTITVSVPRIDAYHLGALIALYERAVSFYASFVGINAYHQPGVQAGKDAADQFLDVVAKARAHLAASPGEASSAAAVADAIGSDPETTFHALTHLAATRADVTSTMGESPAGDTFAASAAEG